MAGARFFQFTRALLCHLEQMAPVGKNEVGVFVFFFVNVAIQSCFTKQVLPEQKKKKKTVRVGQLKPFSRAKWLPTLSDFT